jgi:hypothetical protein
MAHEYNPSILEAKASLGHVARPCLNTHTHIHTHTQNIQTQNILRDIVLKFIGEQ